MDPVTGFGVASGTMGVVSLGITVAQGLRKGCQGRHKEVVQHDAAIDQLFAVAAELNRKDKMFRFNGAGGREANHSQSKLYRTTESSS